MKLRLSEQHLRFRLSENDVSLLHQGKSLTQEVRFSPLESIEIVLEPWQLEVMQASFLYNQIKVNIPQSAIAAWASTAQEGMYDLQHEGLEQPLKISIEKDFPCDHSQSPKEC
jgi:hypothetical protein